VDVAFNLVSWFLLVGGALLVLVGGIGVLRMPTLYTRIHASSLTDSLGPVMVLLGIMLQAGLTLASVKLAVILLFLLMTGPTATYALVNAALLSGMRPDAESLPDNDQ